MQIKVFHKSGSCPEKPLTLQQSFRTNVPNHPYFTNHKFTIRFWDFQMFCHHYFEAIYSTNLIEADSLYDLFFEKFVLVLKI